MGKNNKKKTQEEYVAELAVKNPNLEVIGTYVNAKTKIMHRCRKHNVCWEIVPGSALMGAGCEKCKKEKHYASVAKTHEQYLEEVEKANPNVEVLGTYIDAITPILHKCRICGREWDSTPSNILRGRSCLECGIKKAADRRRRTQLQYEIELKIANPNVVSLEPYINNNTPILHRCTIDNYEWKVLPSALLSGKRCPMCAGNAKKTNEQYVKEVADKNPTITVVEEYKGAGTSILHECNICGLRWSARPGNILHGCGCPGCANKAMGDKNRWTQERYIAELKEKNPTVEVVGEYVGQSQKITHHCLIHDVYWNTSPSSVLQGCGCKLCGAERYHVVKTRTHEQYLEELKNVPNITVLEEYVGCDVSILHECAVCGEKWRVRPSHILRGDGCPRCSSSKGEKKISQWLVSHKIIAEAQKRFPNCRDKKELPFDFYLPELNAAIEYDGKQHFQAMDYFGGEEALRYTQRHDQIKTQYCADNGIRLLRIPYNKNVEDELNNFIYSA